MQNNSRKKKALGYIRVSTKRQATEGVSLQVQEDRIRAYCKAQGWEVVDVLRDEESGGV